VLSREGCTAETEKKTILIESPQPGTAYQVRYVLADNPVPLQARPFGNAYLWQPANNLATTTSANTVFSGMADQVYTVQISTPAGCLTVDTQVVKIVSRMDILVPTAFTPNGDGRNDVLRPALFGMKELTYFRVYNRWGQLVFQTTNPSLGWNGMVGGKIQANQSVVWVAEAMGMDGKKYFRKGTAVCVQ
jgi:gliding motility-associated-like protein